MGRPWVVSVFDKTTTMLKPWAEAGYPCMAVDLQHPRGLTEAGGGITLVGANALDWLPPKGPIAAAFFFPPCTDVAVSGARWFRDKGLGSLVRSLELFKRSVDLGELMGAPGFIENPVCTVSTYWREPDFTFDPYDYVGYEGGGADDYTKRTFLWALNGFVLPPKRSRFPEQGSKFHLLPPSDERANLRSATPAGFARAVFEQLTMKEATA